MLIDKLKKTTKSNTLITFVVLVITVSPIHSFYVVQEFSKGSFSIIMYILGNLLFLHSLSQVIIHIVTTKVLSNLSEQKLQFRYKSNRMHFYKQSAPFILFIVYLMYILCLYFQMYYLLIPISLLCANFSVYTLNKYIYAVNKKLIVWNTWGMLNDFNYVSKYYTENDQVFLILNNEEQIQIVHKDSQLISIKELEQYLDS